MYTCTALANPTYGECNASLLRLVRICTAQANPTYGECNASLLRLVRICTYGWSQLRTFQDSIPTGRDDSCLILHVICDTCSYLIGRDDPYLGGCRFHWQFHWHSSAHMLEFACDLWHVFVPHRAWWPLSGRASVHSAAAASPASPRLLLRCGLGRRCLLQKGSTDCTRAVCHEKM